MHLKMMAIVLLAGLCSMLRADSPNLLKDPSFAEGGAAWRFLKPYYSVDNTVGHSDGFSLHYSGAPNAPYILVCQSIPSAGGKNYVCSVWVKTRDLSNPVKACLQWGNESGYVGEYDCVPGIKGTSGWQQVLFACPPTPEDITYVDFTLYTDGGAVGDIWFDDAEVREIQTPPIIIEYQDPVWHGKTIVVGDTSPDIKLKLGLGNEWKSDPSRYFAKATLRCTVDWPTVGEVQTNGWKDGVAEISVPTFPTPLGMNELNVELIDRTTGKPLYDYAERISVIERVALSIDSPSLMGVVGGVAGEKPELACRVCSQLPPGAPKEKDEVRLLLLPLDGGPSPVSPVVRRITSGEQSIIRFPMDKAPLGTYRLQAELYREGDKKRIAVSERLVTRVEPASRPANAVEILPNRLLKVDGKPFFPIGPYVLSSIGAPHFGDTQWERHGKPYPEYYKSFLKMIGESPLNCVLDYCGDWAPVNDTDAVKGFLDEAQRRGVKVIYSSKDFIREGMAAKHGTDFGSVFGRIKDHPALIANYVSDEGYVYALRGEFAAMAKDVRVEDPWHPTFGCHFRPDASLQWAKWSDAYGIDAYFTMSDIGAAAAEWRLARKSMPSNQPMWSVVQAFSPDFESGQYTSLREPTYQEMRCATFAAIAEGSTGIIYYCLQDMHRSQHFTQRWRDLCSVAGEVQKLVPVIGLPDAIDPVRVTSGRVSLLTKQENGKLYVILVNTKRVGQRVSLQWPAAIRRIVRHGSNESVPFTSHTTQMQLDPLGVYVLVGES